VRLTPLEDRLARLLATIPIEVPGIVHELNNHIVQI
jgi:hypothetical protein